MSVKIYNRVKVYNWLPESDKPAPPVENPKSCDSFDAIKRPFWVETEEKWEKIKDEARALAKEHREAIMQYRKQEGGRDVYDIPEIPSERNVEKQETLLDLLRSRATRIK